MSVNRFIETGSIGNVETTSVNTSAFSYQFLTNTKQVPERLQKKYTYFDIKNGEKIVQLTTLKSV